MQSLKIILNANVFVIPNVALLLSYLIPSCRFPPTPYGVGFQRRFCVKKSIVGTKLYPVDSGHSLPAVSPVEELAVPVTKSRSFEAAMRLARENPGKKIAVHNFASATNPGGTG